MRLELSLPVKTDDHLSDQPPAPAQALVLVEEQGGVMTVSASEPSGEVGTLRVTVGGDTSFPVGSNCSAGAVGQTVFELTLPEKDDWQGKTVSVSCVAGTREIGGDIRNHSVLKSDDDDEALMDDVPLEVESVVLVGHSPATRGDPVAVSFPASNADEAMVRTLIPANPY